MYLSLPRENVTRSLPRDQSTSNNFKLNSFSKNNDLLFSGSPFILEVQSSPPQFVLVSSCCESFGGIPWPILGAKTRAISYISPSITSTPYYRSSAPHNSFSLQSLTLFFNQPEWATFFLQGSDNTHSLFIPRPSSVALGTSSITEVHFIPARDAKKTTGADHVVLHVPPPPVEISNELLSSTGLFSEKNDNNVDMFGRPQTCKFKSFFKDIPCSPAYVKEKTEVRTATSITLDPFNEFNNYSNAAEFQAVFFNTFSGTSDGYLLRKSSSCSSAPFVFSRFASQFLCAALVGTTVVTGCTVEINASGYCGAESSDSCSLSQRKQCDNRTSVIDYLRSQLFGITQPAMAFNVLSVEASAGAGTKHLCVITPRTKVLLRVQGVAKSIISGGVLPNLNRGLSSSLSSITPPNLANVVNHICRFVQLHRTPYCSNGLMELENCGLLIYGPRRSGKRTALKLALNRLCDKYCGNMQCVTFSPHSYVSDGASSFFLSTSAKWEGASRRLRDCAQRTLQPTMQSLSFVGISSAFSQGESQRAPLLVVLIPSAENVFPASDDGVDPEPGLSGADAAVNDTQSLSYSICHLRLAQLHSLVRNSIPSSSNCDVVIFAVCDRPSKGAIHPRIRKTLCSDEISSQAALVGVAGSVEVAFPNTEARVTIAEEALSRAASGLDGQIVHQIKNSELLSRVIAGSTVGFSAEDVAAAATAIARRACEGGEDCDVLRPLAIGGTQATSRVNHNSDETESSINALAVQSQSCSTAESADSSVEQWETIGGLGAVKRRLYNALVAPHLLFVRTETISENSVKFNKDGTKSVVSSTQIGDPRSTVINPYLRMGVSAPRGILLYGPPGTGKTTLLRVMINSFSSSTGELARFESFTTNTLPESDGHREREVKTILSVSSPFNTYHFLYLDLASVISSYVGESELLIRRVFSRARQLAPCILFIDEVEAMCSGRASDSSGDVSGLLSAFLIELDGFSSGSGEVTVICATNLPWMLDSAIMRPGRLDYHLYVGCGGYRENFVETIDEPLQNYGEFEFGTKIYGPNASSTNFEVLMAILLRDLKNRSEEIAENRKMWFDNVLPQVASDGIANLFSNKIESLCTQRAQSFIIKNIMPALKNNKTELIKQDDCNVTKNIDLSYSKELQKATIYLQLLNYILRTICTNCSAVDVALLFFFFPIASPVFTSADLERIALSAGSTALPSPEPDEVVNARAFCIIQDGARHFYEAILKACAVLNKSNTLSSSLKASNSHYENSTFIPLDSNSGLYRCLDIVFHYLNNCSSSNSNEKGLSSPPKNVIHSLFLIAFSAVAALLVSTLGADTDNNYRFLKAFMSSFEDSKSCSSVKGQGLQLLTIPPCPCIPACLKTVHAGEWRLMEQILPVIHSLFSQSAPVCYGFQFVPPSLFCVSAATMSGVVREAHICALKRIVSHDHSEGCDVAMTLQDFFTSAAEHGRQLNEDGSSSGDASGFAGRNMALMQQWRRENS